MTLKFNNVYINETNTLVGPYEHKGPLKDYYDAYSKDLYFNKKSWETAEAEMIRQSVNMLLKKLNLSNDKIDVHLGSDLINQLVPTNYASSKIKIPLIGVYSACASSALCIGLASSMIESKLIKNAIITSSSHNNSAEKQFRNPVEYGGPKKSYTTFTTTGCATAYLSSEKSNIKVESATIGTVVDMGITDVSNMGAVMAPAAAKTIYDHLKDTKRKFDYYDLILTGDLGVLGKTILRDYMKKDYKLDLTNLDDSACIIYDINKQPVYTGGSGVACLPLVSYSYIFNQMKSGKFKRVLLVATGALMNPTMCNQKLSIPSIAHAISLEVNNDIS